MIDIGGPTMIRAAAKNHESVAVVTEPDDYGPILEELKAGGELSLPTCRRLATKAFHKTAHYDFVIANWFSETEGDFPSHILRDYEKVMELSYGENPHQRAAYYAESGARRHLLSRVTQLHGKKLSFNNLYDLHAARALATEFALPACVIIKHNNPCGAAAGRKRRARLLKALESDPVAAFGSVVAVNRQIDAATAQAHGGAVHRGPVRPVLRRRGPRDPDPQSRHPHPGRQRAPQVQPRRDGLQARRWADCSCRTATPISRTASPWRS